MSITHKKHPREKNKNSWINYLGAYQNEALAVQVSDSKIPDGIFNIGSLNQSLFNDVIPWIYLLDYTTGRYLMTSKGVKFLTGYNSDYFTNGGINVVFEIFDREHLRLFNEEIFLDRLNILKNIPVDEHPNYIFNYNLKIKSRNGESVNLLQRNCFIKSDLNGNPLLSYGIITNINHYKSENPVIQIVEKINNAEVFGGTSVISKRHYYFNEEDRLFTKREKELLLWLMDGFCSKEIAKKLFISEYTVINHKRNMMKKCNANNTAELVGFGIKNQLY